jgi:hypothetical protein
VFDRAVIPTLALHCLKDVLLKLERDRRLKLLSLAWKAKAQSIYQSRKN